MSNTSTLKQNLKTIKEKAPKSATIFALLNFSKSYSVANLKSIGQAEIILN